MKVQLPLIGSGVPGDSYRVQYPTYTMVDVDYDNMVAIVDVPEDTLPNDFVSRKEKVTLSKPEARKRAAGVTVDADTPPRLPVEHDDVVVDVSPGEAEAWHERLDTRYPQHAGKFRPYQS